eukprot:scaffold35142_cov55-Phaeocystis_antarctica.AAC.1
MATPVARRASANAGWASLDTPPTLAVPSYSVSDDCAAVGRADAVGRVDRRAARRAPRQLRRRCCSAAARAAQRVLCGRGLIGAWQAAAPAPEGRDPRRARWVGHVAHPTGWCGQDAPDARPRRDVPGLSHARGLAAPGPSARAVRERARDDGGVG